MEEQRKWCLDRESAAGEGAAEIVEMTTKGLEHDTN